jgi:hypothetical protein
VSLPREVKPFPGISFISADDDDGGNEDGKERSGWKGSAFMTFGCVAEEDDD